MKGNYQRHQMYKNYPIEVIPHSVFLEKGRFHEALSLHWHRSIEIVLAKGSNLKIWKSGELISLSDGEMLIINSEEAHAFIIEEDNIYLGVTLIVSYDFLSRQLVNVDDYRFISKPSGQALKSMGDLMEGLLAIFQLKEEWSVFHLQSKSSEILFYLFNVCQVTRSIGEVRQTEYYAERYKLVISYINQHFKESLTLSDVAAYIGLNASFFSRNFKAYIGISFKSYLTKIRLSHASNLIANSEQNISNIAFDSGFPDQKSFIKAFKDKYQMTPSDYRKSL